MRSSLIAPTRVATFALFCAVSCAVPCAVLNAQQDQYPGQDQDPPSRVARIAYTQGNISLEPASVDAFSAAELNYPLTAGDRLYVDNSSLSELQTGGLAIRMGNGADLTITSLTDSVAQFGLAQGSIRVHTRDLYAGDNQQAVVEIDTPNGSILVQQPGDLRVDSYPQDDTTVVTISSGAAEVTAQGFDQSLGAGQSIRLSGSNPVYAERLGLFPPDNLDRFAADRERRREQSASYRDQYVDPDMIGAADLDQYGDWQPSNDYGPVWYPRSVAGSWTPYSVGHWAWVAPWGWTWVDAEPWGFAPFHYGRWNNFGGRWGWIPGPPPSAFTQAGYRERPPRPVYSPALVAFIGGPSFSISLGFGGGSGAGVTAWFPLGPREVYRPWYNTTPAYNNRVNVTNIYNRNVTEIHNTYINRTTNIYNVTNVTNVNYVNRQQATVAVQQRDFAAGRTVAQSQPIRLDDRARQQLAAAPVLTHPLVTPARSIAAPQAPARAVPPLTVRPIVQTRQGFERAGSPPSSTPLRPPTPAQPQPARSPNAPSQPTVIPVNRGNFPQQRPEQVVAPGATAAQPARPAQVVPGNTGPASYGAQRPNTPAGPAQAVPGNTGPASYGARRPDTPLAPAAPAAASSGFRVQQQQPAAPAPATMHPLSPAVAPAQLRPAPRPVDQQRPLVNVAAPQPVAPSFEQQRHAIQQTDPGRPLAPQQMNNLRNNRPAGPGQQETPHPAPVARPNPPAPVRDAKDNKPK